jgi:hypothetical protein
LTIVPGSGCVVEIGCPHVPTPARQSGFAGIRGSSSLGLDRRQMAGIWN